MSPGAPLNGTYGGIETTGTQTLALTYNAATSTAYASGGSFTIAPDSINGIIDFNGGSSGAITVDGTGTLSAKQVNFGTLTSPSLQIAPPFVTVSGFSGSITLGNISIKQSSVHGLMQVSGS